MKSVALVQDSTTQPRPSDRWRTRFRVIRAQTLALIDGLSGEDCAIQSMPDTSPLKWHLAHTTWFFEVFVLERFDKAFRPFRPEFRILFNSYYNGIGEKHPRPERGLLSRPGLDEVLAYRVDVEQRIEALPEDDAIGELIELGLNHEQQHQELMLTDLKHLLSRNPLLPAYRTGWPLTSVKAATAGWAAFEGGLSELGAPATGFAFDNERPRHRVWLDPFELATRAVTYGDVLDFISDDGYRRPELWLSLGWDSVRQQGWQMPLYWYWRDGCWQTFTLRGLMPIERDVPVPHLSYFEADALARWRGARLPTEAEWEVAASRTPIEGNFFESNVFHPLAPQRETPMTAVAQLWGDCWEWTSSAYGPYPGFSAPGGAVGEYNGKFMCNQYVLRGGSCATPCGQLRPSYRNFFPPDARWQFSGARMARSIR